MCGIFGQIKKIVHRNRRIDKKITFQNASLCQHRGPDNTSNVFFTYKDYELYFVFHRLAINGLDSESNQPIYIDDTIIICNGEIYNYKELAEEYHITLRTNSDCEIIPHLYNLMGIQCIKLLDGVFTFLLYDSNNGLVYVGHDPIGIRSGYMIQNEGELIVASEMKSLMDFGEGDIKMIEPGCYIEYNLNTDLYQSFYYYELEFPVKYNQENIIIEKIQSILYQSVEKRMMSD